jgi:hypothetical protein
MAHCYLLTPRCTVLLEKLTGLQLVKKFPAYHGTRRFITALTTVRHLSLSWASPTQSTYPHPTSWRSILIFDVSPGNTPPWRSERGSSLPPDYFVSRASIAHVNISWLKCFTIWGCFHHAQPPSRRIHQSQKILKISKKKSQLWEQINDTSSKPERF